MPDVTYMSGAAWRDAPGLWVLIHSNARDSASANTSLIRRIHQLEEHWAIMLPKVALKQCIYGYPEGSDLADQACQHG